MSISADAPPAGLLSGVRIVDTSSVLFGPYSTQLLGDLGADVIKVEALEGDSVRNIGTSRNPGMAPGFLNANRNKRSIAVDLKHPEGRRIVLDLCRESDIFVTNIRRKAVERLGLAYGDVAGVNRSIVYAKAVGFGEGGPYDGEPAFDDTIQAISGVAAFQSVAAGKPAYVANAIADKVSGLTLALSMVAALRHRDLTGQGQELEVPMFETLAAFTMIEHLYGRTYEPPLGEALYPRLVSQHRRPFATSDGLIAVMPHTDAHWASFFAVIGRPELAQDERFTKIDARTRNIETLYALMAEALTTRSTAQWLIDLRQAGVPAVRINSGNDLLQDPHLNAVGFFQHLEHPSEGTLLTMSPPVRYSRTPAAIRRLAPRLGEHSRDILQTVIGYDAARIEALVAGGVVKAEA